VLFSRLSRITSTAYPIVVCAGIVPDPLQTLEPVASPTGPALKNEMMMPAAGELSHVKRTFSRC
jgi:hypothetical protein